MTFIFPYIGNVTIPNWRTHIFQRGWNHQPDMDLDWVDISRWVHNGYIIIANNSEWLQWLQSFTDGWSKFTCVYINLNHPWFPETDLCEQKKWPPSWNDFLDGRQKMNKYHIPKSWTDGAHIKMYNWWEACDVARILFSIPTYQSCLLLLTIL